MRGVDVRRAFGVGPALVVCGLLGAVDATRAQARTTTVTARVTAADPAPGPGLRTRVTFRVTGARHGLPATIRQTVLGGTRDGRSLVMSHWPLFRRGQVVRAAFGRTRLGWRLHDATPVGATAAWLQLSPPFPAWRMPVRWHATPGTPQWMVDAAIAGGGWWQQDPLSWVQLAWDGSGGSSDPAAACDPAVGSFVAARALRDEYAGAVGLGGACLDASGAFSMRVWLDPDNSDYDATVAAAHEIGHNLGLDHSPDATSVMYAYNHPLTGLQADDLAGLRTLYPGATALDFGGMVYERRMNPGEIATVSVPARVIGGSACSPDVWGTLSGATGWVQGGESGRVALAATARAADSCDGALTLQAPATEGAQGQVELDPAGATGALSGRSTSFVLSVNHRPAVQLSGDASGAVRDALTWRATPDDADGDTVALSWDLDGDGDFDDARGATATTAFAVAGAATVRVRGTDALGLTAEAALEVRVTDGPAPVAAPAAGTAPAPAPSTTTGTAPVAGGPPIPAALPVQGAGTPDVTPSATRPAARCTTLGARATAAGHLVTTRRAALSSARRALARRPTALRRALVRRRTTQLAAARRELEAARAARDAAC